MLHLAEKLDTDYVLTKSPCRHASGTIVESFNVCLTIYSVQTRVTKPITKALGRPYCGNSKLFTSQLNPR